MLQLGSKFRQVTAVIWIDTEAAARLLGISDRAVRKRVQAGDFEVRWVDAADGGGTSGKTLEIFVGSLPASAQIELYAEMPADEIHPPRLIPLDEVSDADRQRIEAKFYAWKAWRRYCQTHSGSKTKVELTAEFIDIWNKAGREPKFTAQTLYRWESLIREHGPGGLLDGRGGHNKGETEIPEEAWAHFSNLYLHGNRLSMKQAYILTEDAAQRLGWGQLPSFTTFKRQALQRFDKQALILAREGNKAFDDKCMPYMQRSYTSLAPNQLWVSDHHRFDLHCTYQGRIVRPWVTPWMDVRSRRIMSLIVSTNPNQNVILGAFAQGAVRHGVPEEVYVDNGKDYKAQGLFSLDEAHVHSLAHRLNLVVHHALPYNAKAKPIERAFKTFKEQFSKLWQTYCGGKPDEKPERLREVLKNARPGDIPTLEQFAAILWDWVEVFYNENPHEGEGMDGKSPRQVHELNMLKKRIMPDDVARLMFMRTEKPRKVQRNGVKIFERWYTNEKLYELLDKDVFVSYNLEEIGRVYVWDTEGRYLCEATNRQMLHYGATAEDFRQANMEKQRVKRLTKERIKALTDGAPDLDLVATIAARRKAVEARKAQEQHAGPKIIEPIRDANFEEAARIIKAQEEAETALAAVGGTAGAFNEWRRGVNKGSNSQASADTALRDALKSIRSLKSNGGGEK